VGHPLAVQVKKQVPPLGLTYTPTSAKAAQLGTPHTALEMKSGPDEFSQLRHPGAGVCELSAFPQSCILQQLFLKLVRVE
jgi:hypothetical protein